MSLFRGSADAAKTKAPADGVVGGRSFDFGFARGFRASRRHGARLRQGFRAWSLTVPTPDRNIDHRLGEDLSGRTFPSLPVSGFPIGADQCRSRAACDACRVLRPVAAAAAVTSYRLRARDLRQPDFEVVCRLAVSMLRFSYALLRFDFFGWLVRPHMLMGGAYHLLCLKSAMRQASVRLESLMVAPTS